MSIKLIPCQNEWYKLKKYPHIGIPSTNRNKIISYIKNPSKIAVHSFAPFIHRTIVSRKYRKDYDKLTGQLLCQGNRVSSSPKKRDIHFANHLDSNIYSFYSCLLREKYESTLEQRGLEHCVTAYRKISLNENSKINKNNIHFAYEVFNFIETNSLDNDLIAISFDIENFFPSLNHNILKKQWCEVLSTSTLPKDHYNLFKNITKFSFVEEQHLFNLFKHEILIKRKDGRVIKKSIDKIDHLYDKNAIAYCDMKGIHLIRKKGLIRSNKFKYTNGSKSLRLEGICQGSPISAMLANIYMLGFDTEINRLVSQRNGIYRRYSDDMIVICSKEFQKEIVTAFKIEIQKIKLNIHPDKTQTFHFSRKNGHLVCEQEFKSGITKFSANRNFEYLGFSFNGENVYLKNSSLAKYYRKMKKGVRRGKFYSNRIQNQTQNELFKKRLYKRYSYIGSERYAKYKRVKGTTDKWIMNTQSVNWGNYITYAKKAHDIMGTYSKIDSQIKNHWKNLHKEIKR